MAASMMGMAAMFPKRPRAQQQKRERGNPKMNVNFRVPDTLIAYVEEREGRGYTRTGVFLRTLEIMRDIDEALGADWWAFERQAEIENTTPGKLIARLALAALEAERKKR
jgi:hypothetical protein